jgi:hypothetical protein
MKRSTLHYLIRTPLVIGVVGVISLNGALAAEGDDPLDPNYKTPQQKAYWEQKATKMDVKGEGRVTRESFVQHYADLWDQHVPADKKAVSIDELARTWASLETKNPLDPEYKTALWRREHVKTMDTDNDGTVTRDEFLKHMGTEHWDVAAKNANANTMPINEVMDMMSDNPLDPRHRFR